MHQNSLHSASLLLAAALFASTASAQTILWGNVQPTLGPTDVSLNGTLVVARNLHAAGAAQSPTVNSVPFAGSFAPTGWTNASTNAMQGSTTGDVAYDLLLNSARATSAAATANPTGWGAIRLDTLGSITVGRTYEIQCWFTDQRSGAAALYDRVMTLSSAVGPATLTGGEVNNLGSLLQGPLSGPLDADPDNNPALGGTDTVFGSYCIGYFTPVNPGDQTWLLVQGSHPVNNLRSHLTAFQIRDLSASHQNFGTGCYSPSPLTLSAAPSPVINPSTLVTYTITNIPEYVPTSGVYLSTLFLSVNPLPGGFDLTGILTVMPGCNAYIATLDVNIGTAVTAAPTSAVPFTFAAPVFAPGNVIAAQAVALFDGTFPLPNGETGGFVFSNGVLSTTQTQ